ncbi:tRNA glutamyl-Q(34) synthetase GluQRS [Nitrincola iocasae]|uniref:Glutamyl-Q tRNA(Asp) synthetase n=1 Tax=Nitrincola iocasae TaxID=2614693 RepID=A0A5J6LAZ4_9GAMM|nr:tRNA glutamyl-Q(34) synthetase GluQRS [Nitrincola iocasae]QEW05521.1 tRNA glutamyl-Q(34) synthetase GluQRS [Nitrincola iocasae]
MSYTGRFAPSPTGPLHFGSLLAALASYLDAKHQQGRWLLRIENPDPLREQPGATDQILYTLDTYGLHWDGEVIYQNQRQDYYQHLLEKLIQQDLAYPCDCSRKQLKLRNALQHYDRHCLKHPPDKQAQTAIRARYTLENLCFNDRILGIQQANNCVQGDFIIFRRDGLFAYQLAVVADDHAQKINQVVRGADLLQETFAQIQLQQHLNLTSPDYAHIPLATTADGQKLSKQNLAPALENRNPAIELLQALRILNQELPPEPLSQTVESLLQWAISHWHIERVPAIQSIPIGA